jgi:hypothetical protein
VKDSVICFLNVEQSVTHEKKKNNNNNNNNNMTSFDNQRLIPY